MWSISFYTFFYLGLEYYMNSGIKNINPYEIDLFEDRIHHEDDYEDLNIGDYHNLIKGKKYVKINNKNV